MSQKQLPAKIGLGVVVDSAWKPVLKTKQGWERWGKEEALRKKKKEKIPWECVVGEFDGYYRVNFAYQKER